MSLIDKILNEATVFQFSDFQNAIHKLKNKYVDKGCRVEFEWNQHNHYCILDRLSVPMDEREKGIGTNFMKEFCSLADKYDVALFVYPSGGLGGDVDRLIQFYGRFNFTPFNDEYMRRLPNKYLI